MRDVSCTLYGTQTRLRDDDERMLLEVLRYDLNLTGTKFSCGVGLCSAHTVLVDGVAVGSRSPPLKEVAGRQVLTFERLEHALTENVRFRTRKVFERDFDTYEIPRFSWLPKIEAFIIPNDGLPASGGGEPAIINMGAVVANAVFDATGARLFRLPMTPARVKEALAGATKK